MPGIKEKNVEKNIRDNEENREKISGIKEKKMGIKMGIEMG